MNWWRKRSHRSLTKDRSREYTRWEKDYQLQDPGRLALFEEYLEMGKYFQKKKSYENGLQILHLQVKTLNIKYQLIYSSAVWFCNIICSSISTGTFVCIVE